jgi:selenocysteine lyase/cysteine desulfurase
VRLTERCFDSLDGTQQAVLFVDHITSGSGVLMPLDRLSALCRLRNVLVVVDGAHAIGQVEIDFAKVHVDFYTSNLHKWCFVPRSCAFLFTRKAHQV